VRLASEKAHSKAKEEEERASCGNADGSCSTSRRLSGIAEEEAFKKALIRSARASHVGNTTKARLKLTSADIFGEYCIALQNELQLGL